MCANRLGTSNQCRRAGMLVIVSRLCHHLADVAPFADLLIRHCGFKRLAISFQLLQFAKLLAGSGLVVFHIFVGLDKVGQSAWVETRPHCPDKFQPTRHIGKLVLLFRLCCIRAAAQILAAVCQNTKRRVCLQLSFLHCHYWHYVNLAIAITGNLSATN